MPGHKGLGQLRLSQIDTILATIPAGVFIVDGDGAFITVNDRAREIWGGEAPMAASVSGYEVYRGRRPDTGEPLRPEDWAAAHALAGEYVDGDLVDIERFDGTQGTIVNSAAPLYGDDGQIVGAVVAIQDVTEQRQRQRTTELVLEAISALGSLRLSEVLDRLVHVLLEVGSHSRASVLLWDEQEREIEVAAYAGEPRVRIGKRVSLENTSSFLQRATETLRPVVADLATLPAQEQGFAAHQGVSSSLILPLVRGDVLLGFATVDEVRPGKEFTSAEIQLAAGIAVQASVAIENARLYEAEHRVAETLQQALLALPKKLDGVVFAHAYRSASEAAYVGGDFYDLFEIEHDLLGIIVGDIAGKGLEAAVLTSFVKNTIRAHAAEKGAKPARILALTNDLFYQSTTSDAFATVFFGVLDRRTGRLLYTNAGHTTGAIMGGKGPPRELPANSPLLGAFPQRDFHQVETRLGAGELLLLYTDGITEARESGKMYGEQRLFQVATSLEKREPDEVVQAVVDDVLAFASRRLSDDLAILCLRRTADVDDVPLQHKLEVSSSVSG